MVGLRCGLRLGEIIALRWREDLDLVTGRLVVNRAVSRGRIETPKNGRTREIPLGLEVLRALKGHRHLKGELVFPGPMGRLLHKEETKHPLWRACRKAGLRRIGWHVLRCGFRGMAITHFGAWRSLISVDRDHPFRRADHPFRASRSL